MNLTVHQAVYHRNGITGIGFYAITFAYVEDGITREAIATVSDDDVQKVRRNQPHDPSTRVLMFQDNGSGLLDISRTMRGDHFHPNLCRYLIGHEDQAAAGFRKVSKPAS